MSNWKAYDEVHFSNEYILRWVREGDEYVSRITCDMMDDLQSIVRQQADRIAELEKENSNFKYEVSSGAWQSKEATDQELFNVYAHLQDTYEGDNFPVALGRKILKLYTTPQTKPLSDEEIDDVAKNNFEGVGRLIYMIAGNVKGDDFRQAVRSFARAIEAKVRGEK